MLSKDEKAARVAYLKDLVSNADPALVEGHVLLQHFSARNALLILCQLPTASACAGFHAWRAAGRSVRKGEKGLGILAPVTIKGEDDSEGRLAFRVVHVFDISQTEPLSADSPRLARELVSA